MLLTGLLMEFVHVLLAVFFYFFLMSSSSLSPDLWVTYILTGLLILPLLDWSFSGPYLSLDNAYFNMELQWVCLSPTKPITLVLAQHIAGYGRVIVSSLMYAVSGLILGLEFNLGWKPILKALLALLYGCVVTSGVGLLLSTMFLHMSRIRGLSNPVLVFLSFFSTNFCGAYFPVGDLPLVLRAVSFVLPQTHVVGLVRMILGQEQIWSVSPIISMGYLAVVFLVSVPLAYKLFETGILRVKREGFIIPPQRSFVKW